MRTRAALLALLTTALLAGCLGGGDEPGTTTTPAITSPVATTPEATTPPATSTPATTTPSGPTPPPAEPLPPKVIYERVFEFTQGDATGQSPKVETSQATPQGYANVTVNVTIERGGSAPTPLPVSGTLNSPMVRILDPEGIEVFAEGEEGAAHNATYPAKAGAWTIRFEGAGTLRASVKLTAVA